MTPLALYSGKIVHIRHIAPVGRHRQAMLWCLLDLDGMAGSRRVRLFGHNRFNLFAFYDRDHGAQDGSDLPGWVRAKLVAARIPDPGGPIRLLTQPRVLGHVFNPLSIFLCYGPDGTLRAAVYEVHNTYGEAHAYAAPVLGEPPHRHETAKDFRVSPFLPMAGSYAFALSPPGSAVRLKIMLKSADGDPLLTATLSGGRQRFGDRALIAAFLKLPFSTLRASAAIYRQAAQIWLKSGLRPRPR